MTDVRVAAMHLGSPPRRVTLLTLLGAIGCTPGADAHTRCDTSPCLEGFACDGATLTCVRACTASGGCLDSERCDLPYGGDQGLCTPSTYCVDGGQCAEGWACTTETPSICLRACSTEGGCLDSERCDLPAGADTGVCRPRPYCTPTNDPCGALACDTLTHLCRSRCTTGAECASTETCEIAAGATEGICRLVVVCQAGDAVCGTLATCDVPAGADQGVCRPNT